MGKAICVHKVKELLMMKKLKELQENIFEKIKSISDNIDIMLQDRWYLYDSRALHFSDPYTVIETAGSLFLMCSAV